MRTPKIGAPKHFEFIDKSDLIRETREYELITPLFGGGAENKKADEVSVIRATEIRGHLRFWWRATRGGQFNGDLEKMKETEDAIFGSTDKYSALQIEVEIIKRGQNFPKQKDFKGELQAINSIKSPFSYVAFPLRGEAHAQVIENIRFQIKITFPLKFDTEIKASLWAWENFGGIGARTRRGFGAFYLAKVNQTNHALPNLSQYKSSIESALKNYIKTENFPNNVPHLSQQVIFTLTKRNDSAQKSWQFLINKLQNFRQYRKNKDTGQVSKFGASQWTEPNSLRYRMNKRNYKPQIDKFPRSEFGLPILFEMKHDHFKTTLKGKGEKPNEFIERLASPLILRPVKCSDGFIGVALILQTPRTPPNGLVLTDVKKNEAVQAQLTKSEAEDLSKTLEILENEPDVLQAFLKYLEK